MGLFQRLFGKGEDDESPVPDKVLNDEVRRAQLTELESTLDGLVQAMQAATTNMENPGWRGRARDYSYALGGAKVLLKSTTITKDAVFELTTTIRPLFRGDAPEEYIVLAPLNQRLIVVLADLERPAAGE